MLRRAAIAAPVTLALVATLAIPRATTATDPRVALRGQWMIDPDGPSTVRLTFRSEGPHHSSSTTTEGVTAAQLDGLPADALEGGSHGVAFRCARDAGTFNCVGRIDERRGGGTFELMLDPGFAAKLERRGVGAPTEEQQVRLALANTGFALLDELARLHYSTPEVVMLVRMADHGVDLEYVRGLDASGYRLETLANLVRARDHGVDPEYIGSLREAGYSKLSFAQLLAARDHGVDGEFLGGMRRLGFGRATLDDLRSARDHGADPEYITAMAAAGYKNLPLERFIEARDHGVDAEYVSDMAEAGFKQLPLDRLIAARDHGVDGAFARHVTSARGPLPIEDVISLRDRGER